MPVAIATLRATMKRDWNSFFSAAEMPWKDNIPTAAPPPTLAGLKQFLDLAHCKHCLLRPYTQMANYPAVDLRELVPSFESDPFENKELPGFSLVAFARPIIPFTEIFQFDLLAPTHAALRADLAQANLLRNLETAQIRLPRYKVEAFRAAFGKEDITRLANYPALLPFLLDMDRGQVIGLSGSHPQNMHFSLCGLYASFPSDLDAEVKRYGLRIGKFSVDAHDMYDRNRLFVLQHLMELYGYPVASERRTSAALFARRLHKMGESFLVRTLGQSDRTITTIWSDGSQRHYPNVEKIAIVRLDEVDTENYNRLREKGFLLDESERTVLLRVLYHQHKFSPENVRQERAISVAGQEVIHPLTGQSLGGVNILRESSNMFLRLNDIVRGEYTGRIVYKRSEVVENTDTDEKRLKFLYAWLTKHQRRIIGYRDEFYAKIQKVLDSYLLDTENYESLVAINELYQEVLDRYSYIEQARTVRMLEDLAERTVKGERITYKQMLTESVSLFHDLRFEIVSYFEGLVSASIHIGENMLNDRYLIRTYIEKEDVQLSKNGLEIKKLYRKLVTLVDELKAIRKTRGEAKPALPAAAPRSSGGDTRPGTPKI